MDYKERYEEALETVQEILNSGSEEIKMSRLKLRLQSVFPELKEKKIREGLIKAVSAILNGEKLYGTDVTREEALAWLEKQGEQKPTIIDVDDMVAEYANDDERGNENFGRPLLCMIRAYKQGICDTLEKQRQNA